MENQDEHAANGSGSDLAEAGIGATTDPSRIIEVPLQTSELLEINLDELRDDETTQQEITELFTAERAPVVFWIKILNEFYRRGAVETALRMGEKGVAAFRSRGEAASTVPLLCMMASYAMLQSRGAPKTVLPSPRQYHVKVEPKTAFFNRASMWITQAEQIDPKNGFVLDTKANLYLVMGRIDDAFRTYEHILSITPGHLFALMGKARILYVRRQYAAALKIYQTVLSAAPAFQPDPRIGIGLCFWNLGEHRVARRAWHRSRVVNPGKASTGASLLLGLSWLNAARDPNLPEDDRVETYSRGLQLVQEAWSMDKTCAATAAALSGYFLTSMNKWDTVIKLAELAVQHGDSKATISDGQMCIARALHAQGKLDDATRHYLLAREANPNQSLAALGVAQMLLVKKDVPAAVNAYENVLRKNPRSIEAMVSLASIHADSAFKAARGSEAAEKSRLAASELYEQVVQLFQGTAVLKDGLGDRGAFHPLGPRVQQIARDPDLYIEIARLCAGQNMTKALQAYRQGLEVRRDLDETNNRSSEANPDVETSVAPAASIPSVPPSLLCNIACLEFARGNFEAAQENVEEAITIELARQQALKASGGPPEGDAIMMTLMYNLGIIMEGRGQTEDAVQLYETRLLARHPEYVEAKARLAAIALGQKQHDRCSDFLKAALTARPDHLDIRALYVHFLIEVGNPSAAKDFAVMTLKDFSKTDTYALSAMAHLLYQQARENRGMKPEDLKERSTRFYRACEAFDRVLQLDAENAYAAQGLAIALAENNIGSLHAAGPAHAAHNDATQRTRNLRDALTILTKVRESVNDGNVYVNIGICHFLREEFERAIESFETANNRIYRNKHVQTLLYLARARYHKANRDQSFYVLQQSLDAAELALALSPTDDSIRFNIALVQQRGLETVQNLPASRRRLAEIQKALSDAEAAQETFAALASKTGPNLPYSADLADQRRRYGEGLIKRAPSTLKEQEEYEENEQNKVELAKRDREAERARQAEVERQKREAALRQAEELAAQRRQMIEDAKSWYVKPVSESEDEETKEKGKKGGKGRKKKNAADDGIVPDGEGEEVDVKPKKRKKKEPGEGGKRKKKAKTDDPADEGEAQEAGSDGGEAKASGNDEEDEGPKRAGGRKTKRQFRTAEYIEDSDVSE